MKSRAVERLQKVVDGVELKRPDGELLVGCDEDYQGKLSRGERLQHLETVLARHPHVQKQDVDRKAADGRQGLLAVLAFAGHFHVALRRKQSPDGSPRQRLVVNDQHSIGFHEVETEFRG